MLSDIAFVNFIFVFQFRWSNFSPIWLQVAEEYAMVPDTLYLTVNYIDRYLSGNEINRQELQLLGVACMLIAA